MSKASLFGKLPESGAVTLLPAQAPAGLTLIRLHVRNFKGARDFEMRLSGRSANVYGDNATGKTTLADAYNWLLFDKDSADRKDFSVKRLDTEGHAESGLEHEVEAVFLHNGKELTLRKVLVEEWTKKHGAPIATFSGHTYKYFIDGVPTPKQKYDERIASVFNERLFQMLSDPMYFNNQLHWQTRRTILLEVCGDISDADVIALNPPLDPLTETLAGRTLDEHRKVVGAKRTAINKELTELPVRISEVQRGLPAEIELESPATTEVRLGMTRQELAEKQTELARAEQGEGVGQLEDRLAGVSAQVRQIESAYRERDQRAWLARRQKAQDCQLAVEAAEVKLRTARERLTSEEARVQQVDAELGRLRESFYQLDAQQFTPPATPTICPACGQTIPQELTDQAVERAQEQWNRDHAETEERVSTAGRTARSAKEQAEKNVAEAHRAVAGLEAQLPDLRTQAAAAAQSAAAIVSSNPSQDSAYVKLTMQREGITGEIGRVRLGGKMKTDALRSEIAAMQQGVQVAERLLAQVQQRIDGLARIEELKTREKSLAGEYERLGQELYLTEEFIRAKVRMLTERINSRFALARFKLFDVQVNGAVAECCDTTVQGVPWRDLNHGAQVAAGLDIISTLSAHYGFIAPVWIDRRESVTRLPEMPCQVISLVVSEKDKTLRVEVL